MNGYVIAAAVGVVAAVALSGVVVAVSLALCERTEVSW